MKDREVVQKLKTAFTAALPAFPEAVFEQCSERQKGAVTEMTENKNRSGKIRAAIIAAALAAYYEAAPQKCDFVVRRIRRL